METRVTSSTKEVIIGGDQPTVIIGERINPSANKKLAEALKTGDMEEIVRKEPTLTSIMSAPAST